jgi:hypothetical protein
MFLENNKMKPNQNEADAAKRPNDLERVDQQEQQHDEDKKDLFIVKNDDNNELSRIVMKADLSPHATN